MSKHGHGPREEARADNFEEQQHQPSSARAIHAIALRHHGSKERQGDAKRAAACDGRNACSGESDERPSEHPEWALDHTQLFSLLTVCVPDILAVRPIACLGTTRQEPQGTLVTRAAGA